MAKCCYIFHWKFAVRIHDVFAAGFLTAANVVLSSMLAFVDYAVGDHNRDPEFHICTGRRPTGCQMIPFSLFETVA